MGNTRDLFKEIFHAKMDTVRDRTSKDLKETEDIKKRWQENKKTKQPFYCVIPSRVWSLLELFSSSQSLSSVQLFVTPWTAACQASLSIANSWSLLKLMSIVSVMPSSHFIFCHPLLLLPSIFPSIRVFSNESAIHFRQS